MRAASHGRAARRPTRPRALCLRRARARTQMRSKSHPREPGPVRPAMRSRFSCAAHPGPDAARMLRCSEPCGPGSLTRGGNLKASLRVLRRSALLCVAYCAHSGTSLRPTCLLRAADLTTATSPSAGQASEAGRASSPRSESRASVESRALCRRAREGGRRGPRPRGGRPSRGRLGVSESRPSRSGAAARGHGLRRPRRRRGRSCSAGSRKSPGGPYGSRPPPAPVMCAGSSPEASWLSQASRRKPRLAAGAHA